MVSSRKKPEEPARRRAPAKTPEARENQLIAAAVDLAEKQILDGTVSSQVLSIYLKYASTQHALEQENLRLQNELLAVKRDAIANAETTETLYREALDAMRAYQGNPGGHG